MSKVRKLIDLTPECVRQINIEAAKKGTVFKLMVEQILGEINFEPEPEPNTILKYIQPITQN